MNADAQHGPGEGLSICRGALEQRKNCDRIHRVNLRSMPRKVCRISTTRSDEEAALTGQYCQWLQQ